MAETTEKTNMVKVKFNAYCYPKMKFNEVSKRFEPVGFGKDITRELLKMKNQKGDTEEETKYLESIFSRNLTLEEQLNIICNNSLGENASFYYKDEVVELPKKEAQYYINQYCGGKAFSYKRKFDKSKDKLEIEAIESHYKQSIDNVAYFYKENELNRYEREYKGVPVAEIVND